MIRFPKQALRRRLLLVLPPLEKKRLRFMGVIVAAAFRPEKPLTGFCALLPIAIAIAVGLGQADLTVYAADPYLSVI